MILSRAVDVAPRFQSQGDKDSRGANRADEVERGQIFGTTMMPVSSIYFLDSKINTYI